MAIFLTILKFLSCGIGVFCACVFILSCIGSVINPEIVIVNDKAVERGDHARIVFSIIMAVAWGIFSIL